MSKSSGQSIIEVLIAVAIGVIMITGSMSVLAPAIQSAAELHRRQTAEAYARELLENTVALSESSWHELYDRAKGNGSHYYLTVSGGSFAVNPGDEPALTISGIPYSRYFYIENVTRGPAGHISGVCGAADICDPSLQKVTVVYSWPRKTPKTVSRYLVRAQNNYFFQADWSGGPGLTAATTDPGNRFFSSTNIDYTSSTGSIIISGY